MFQHFLLKFLPKLKLLCKDMCMKSENLNGVMVNPTDIETPKSNIGVIIDSFYNRCYTLRVKIKDISLSIYP